MHQRIMTDKYLYWTHIFDSKLTYSKNVINQIIKDYNIKLMKHSMKLSKAKIIFNEPNIYLYMNTMYSMKVD